MRTHNGCVVIDERDLGKWEEQLLMDLIYEHTRQRIPIEYITYGLPQELDARPDLKYDPNTFIPVRIDPRWDDRFASPGGPKGFMYRRRTFQEYFEDIDFTIDVDEFPFWVKDLVDSKINPHVPYPLDPEKDVLNYQFKERDATSFPLIAHPHSYIWAGRTPMKINPIDPIWYKLVPDPFMPGFVEYVAPAP